MHLLLEQLMHSPHPHPAAMIKLRLGGEVFEVEKETLLKVKDTYFHGLLSSGAWQPDSDGVYYIDGPALGFGRILEYLSSGKLSFKGLTRSEVQCVYDNIDYFLIPYPRFDYTTQTLIEGFKAHTFCELSDGICGTCKNDIIVWNLDTNAIEMTLKGHSSSVGYFMSTSCINQVIQLHDGRVCSCSDDTTIKRWNVSTGLCELTLTGHSREVKCIIQLFDGRICSGAWDKTVRVWNVSTGACEMTLSSDSILWSIAQLPDGRICCGGGNGTISVYSLQTGEWDLSWKGYTSTIHAIICIDATRICSCSYDGRIKVWNTVTGESERALQGHTGAVTSMVLMHDGRLCSGSYDGTIKLWNPDTGESEEILACSSVALLQVQQLADGRVVYITDTTTSISSTRNEVFLVWMLS